MHNLPANQHKHLKTVVHLVLNFETLFRPTAGILRFYMITLHFKKTGVLFQCLYQRFECFAETFAAETFAFDMALPETGQPIKVPQCPKAKSQMHTDHVTRQRSLLPLALGALPKTYIW